MSPKLLAYSNKISKFKGNVMLKLIKYRIFISRRYI